MRELFYEERDDKLQYATEINPNPIQLSLHLPDGCVVTLAEKPHGHVLEEALRAIQDVISAYNDLPDDEDKFWLDVRVNCPYPATDKELERMTIRGALLENTSLSLEDREALKAKLKKLEGDE